jgi:hypothetical protein
MYVSRIGVRASPHPSRGYSKPKPKGLLFLRGLIHSKGARTSAASAPLASGAALPALISQTRRQVALLVRS